MYIKRNIENTIKKVSSEFPVLVLTGARQVGKSTMLQLIKENDMNYVTLDDLDARNLALNDPKYFLEQYSYPLLIDEIQYAPILLSYIKMIVDEERLENLKNNECNKTLFWLTGSQQFKVMKEVSESLAGRIGILNLYSLSLSEILNNGSDVFNPSIENLKKKKIKSKLDTKQIFEIIYNGGMPSIVTKTIERNDYFSSYINTYIERDVKQLLNVGKKIEFYNFMQYIAVRTAQEVNYATIAKEIGVDSKTIKNWISILESSGIIYLLQPYHSNLSNRIIKAPKLYFMDTGLCSYLAKYPNAETLEFGALGGAIFETFVVSELIKNFTSHGVDPKMHLYYYRDKDQKEIDLIYAEANALYPIEIKKGVSPNHPDKHFEVLKKYSDNVLTGLVFCMSPKLQPINKNCWLVPIEYI
ncbi:MAG: ATP-binding protein [Erysipelotrichaceae bacterium]|nr:ATP-binding protein [Erysipelotrichaceae bacterium]